QRATPGCGAGRRGLRWRPTSGKLPIAAPRGRALPIPSKRTGMKSGGLIPIATLAAAVGAASVGMAIMGPRSEPTGSPRSATGPQFVNWETHPVHSLEITPGGDRLLLANTPAGTLEVCDIASGEPALIASVPVGVDPVSVRAQSDEIAWVVNHVSDTVSRVDLRTMSVTATID